MNTNMKFVLLTLALLLPSTAQIVHEQSQPPAWALQKKSVPASGIYTLPAIDFQAITREDAITDADKSVPWRFAVPFTTQLHPANSGAWQTGPDGGRLWRLRVVSEGALSLNIIFSEFALLEGERVFIFSEDREQVLGPLTSLNNKPWGSLATRPVEGERVIVEYYVPAGRETTGKLEIGQIAHGYRELGRVNLQKGLNDAGDCNNNVICPEWEEWSCHFRSAVKVFKSGSRICSGTLINNHSGDGRPLILTAEHCLDGNEDEWVFRFNWISPTCNNTTDGPHDQSISGSQVLVQDGGTDFVLLEMSEKPPASYNVFYSGWDARGFTPQRQIGIHHPSGDVMKISLDEHPAAHGSWNVAETWSVTWDDGTTEPGSSGSGLWDEHLRLVGQLYGGDAACSDMGESDEYGRLDLTWDNGARKYLDPDNTGIKVLDGMGSGDCAEKKVSARFDVSAAKSCDGDVEFTNMSFNAVSWEWDFGDGSTSTSENPDHKYTSGGEYTVSLKASGSGGNQDSYTAVVTVNASIGPVLAGDSVCEGGSATLTADVPESISVDWFANEDDQTPLHSGSSLLIDNLTATARYWAEIYEEEEVFKVGPEDNTMGPGKYFVSSTAYGMYVTVESPVIIKSMKFYSDATGSRTLDMQNLDLQTRKVKTVEIGSGEQRVTLDWAIDPGRYFMKLLDGSDVQLYRNESGADYPYEVPGLLRIDSSSAPGAGQDYYYHFYDWEIQPQTCSAERLSVEAVYTGSCTLAADVRALPSAFRILPNPESGTFTLASQEKIAVKVSNTNGQVLFSSVFEPGQHLLDLSSHKPGVYLMHFPGTQYAPLLITRVHDD